MNATETKTPPVTDFLATGRAIAVRHVAPAQLELAAAEIAKALAKERDIALKEFAVEKIALEAATAVLKRAGLHSALAGDIATSLGLFAVDVLLQTHAAMARGEAKAAG